MRKIIVRTFLLINSQIMVYSGNKLKIMNMVNNSLYFILYFT